MSELLLSILVFPIDRKLTKTPIIFSRFALIHTCVTSLFRISGAGRHLAVVCRLPHRRRRGPLLLGANTKLLKFLIRNTTFIIVFNLFFGALSSEKYVSMWESSVNSQNLRKCLSCLQKASHCINAVLVISLLGVGDELSNQLDQKLRILFLLTMHQREYNEKLFY